MLFILVVFLCFMLKISFVDAGSIEMLRFLISYSLAIVKSENSNNFVI